MATTTKSPSAANINTGTSEASRSTGQGIHSSGSNASFSERASNFASGTVDKAKERPWSAAAIVGGVAAAAAAAVYGGTRLAQNRSSKSGSSKSSKKSS